MLLSSSVALTSLVIRRPSPGSGAVKIAVYDHVRVLYTLALADELWRLNGA
jgi:hypothetical protein